MTSFKEDAVRDTDNFKAALPAAKTESSQKTELVFSLSRFSSSLIGTSDEIWLGVLKAFHSTEKHTKSGWKAVIDSYRHKPAHKQ